MTLTQLLQGGGLLAFLGVLIAAWLKFKTDSGHNANTNWGAIVEGYKEQVSYFSSQVKDMRIELREATERYERDIETLVKERDHFKELYLQSDRKKVEWKEKYEAKVLEIKEFKKGGVQIENELENKI